jgi:tetratricopeptide (TPR) repeat protein
MLGCGDEFQDGSLTGSCAAHTVEADLAIARRALGERDLGHAAFHIATALVTDPKSAEAAAVFDSWFAACDNALGLVTSREDDHWEGWYAMRARTYAKLGRSESALPLLAKLAAAVPEKSYLSWLALIRKPSQISDEAAESSAVELLSLANALPEPLPLDHPARGTVAAALQLLADFRELKRQLPAPLHATAILLRKQGKLAEALTAARALYELRPDWRSLATLSSTLRASGDLQGALDMARRGTELTPPDSRAAMWLDVGDLCLALDRVSDARQAYGAALELEPDNTWARSSFPYARFRELGSDADRATLRQWSLDHPDDDRAFQLLSEIGEPLLEQAFLPSDASVGVFRQLQQSFLETPPTSGPIEMSMALSAPEAPSNMLVSALLERVWGQRLKIELSVASNPIRDSREPLPGAEVALWCRAGDGFEAALAPPDATVQRELGELAASPYRLSSWAERARILGEALGPARVEDLLRAMVHPPGLPHPRYDPGRWIQNVQVAAALALSYVDQGWHGSTRRAMLLSLARGPVDWSVTAAIVALMWTARHEPQSVSEIEALFEQLRRRRPSDCCYGVPLRQAWLLLPNVSPELRTTLQHELAMLSGDEPPEADAGAETPFETPNDGPGWRRPVSWAIALASAFLPAVWPHSLGIWWMLGSIVGLGIAFWVWVSGVPTLPRGSDS